MSAKLTNQSTTNVNRMSQREGCKTLASTHGRQ